ncbi:hypothetical protein WICPIJ_006071 [Wickerhamomyces pijperi]|uniref:Cyclin-like domain-containing protein n=1 Tax=Wickerhamomyces pijperi TaxID=599730 RepID=A0A9P8Q2R2_WICPI|nr:hypothetical protein WICPIJ_006071 [Wickerhamomyces pijperi]
MFNSTPNSLKRKVNARMLANNAVLKQMELRAHSETLKVYKDDIISTISEPRYQQQNFKVFKDLIETQPEITLQMRPILFEFLMEVHSRLKLTNQVFYSTVNIIDRYSSVRIVRKDHLQLLGLTALWISCKYFETKSKIPHLQYLNATCCNCYSKVLFTEMENHILKTLEWEISSKTHDFLIDLKVIELVSTHELRSSFKYCANFVCQILQFHAEITLVNTIEDIVDSVLVITGEALNIDITSLEIEPNHPLVDQIAEALNKSKTDFPQAIKARYFCNTDDFFSNVLLAPLFHHPKVNPPKLQELLCPATPASLDTMSLFSTCVDSPFSFRAPLSTQSSFSSIFISTPPTSEAPSPVENMATKRSSSTGNRETKRSRLCELDNYF